MSRVEQAVYDVLADILQRRSGEEKQISREQSLAEDLGFGSMDYAEAVAMLEMKLEADPFADEVSITRIRTVGDLCEAYEGCACRRAT